MTDTERVHVFSEHLADLAAEYIATVEQDHYAVVDALTAADTLARAVLAYQAQRDGETVAAYEAARDRAQAAIDRLADAHGTGRAT